MTNILKINSSGRIDGSVSRDLTERLVNRFDGANVVDRDVSSGLSAVSQGWIGANFTPPSDRTAAQENLLSQSDMLVNELRDADVLVIGMPIYNFGVPAALKQWIDLICRVGETFQYGENGPEGLVSGKRAFVTVASGGVPVGSPMDHATGFLTQVLGFIGITEVTYISATGLAVDPETPVKTAQAQIDALDLRAA